MITYPWESCKIFATSFRYEWEDVWRHSVVSAVQHQKIWSRPTGLYQCSHPHYKYSLQTVLVHVSILASWYSQLKYRVRLVSMPAWKHQSHSLTTHKAHVIVHSGKPDKITWRRLDEIVSYKTWLLLRTFNLSLFYYGTILLYRSLIAYTA